MLRRGRGGGLERAYVALGAGSRAERSGTPRPAVNRRVGSRPKSRVDYGTPHGVPEDTYVATPVGEAAEGRIAEAVVEAC